MHDSNIQIDPFGLSENPLDYLKEALNLQGINTGDLVPSNFKQKWTDPVTGTKYEVRIHPKAPSRGSGDIFRVARKEPGLDALGQGKGMDYLSTDGNWYSEKVLREKTKLGDSNPNFNNKAAETTHIDKPLKCP